MVEVQLRSTGDVLQKLYIQWSEARISVAVS